MEWEKASGSDEERRAGEGEVMTGEGGILYVKVMTDEQMELLRKQISIYATICEQLVEMHKAVTAQQDSLAGMRLGGLYCDPLMIPGGPKITARQRWTPTPMQLQILENIFDQGNGTPTKQKIKEITLELSHHGQISETNVYNWFQNRRARSKRKHAAAMLSNAESDEESPTEKKPKSEKAAPPENWPARANDLSYSEVHFDPESDQIRGLYASNDSSRSSGSSGQLSFYENMLSNPRMDHLMEKVESPGRFCHFRPGESFDMLG